MNIIANTVFYTIYELYEIVKAGIQLFIYSLFGIFFQRFISGIKILDILLKICDNNLELLCIIITFFRSTSLNT